MSPNARRTRAGGPVHHHGRPSPTPRRKPQVHNPSGAHRVLVTKPLPGDRWLEILKAAGARVEVCTAPDTILSVPQIKGLIGDKCDGVIGQLTEVGAEDVGEGGAVHARRARPLSPPLRTPQDWSDALFGALKQAGGKVYSNYAVG